MPRALVVAGMAGELAKQVDDQRRYRQLRVLDLVEPVEQQVPGEAGENLVGQVVAFGQGAEGAAEELAADRRVEALDEGGEFGEGFAAGAAVDLVAVELLQILRDRGVVIVAVVLLAALLAQVEELGQALRGEVQFAGRERSLRRRTGSPPGRR